MGISCRPRIIELICLLLAIMTLNGCSSTRLAYRFADTGVIWWVEDYVTLTHAQTSALKRDLGVLRDWHCGAELPRYADWLADLEQEVGDGNLPPPRIAHYRSRAIQFSEPLAARIVPAATRLLESLSDEQVEELLANMRIRHQETRKEFLEDDTPEKAAARTRERVERWLGPLNPQQQVIIRQWTSERAPRTRIWLEGRALWQAAFAQLMADRDADDFRVRLRDLILQHDRYRGDAYPAMMEANIQSVTRLTHDLLSAAEERHWQHLRGEANELRGDLVALACAVENTASLN
ncbi:hypothetical protein SAMN05216203_2427 [Marinobacter daqiaonensis]|uniref:Lipoprotein n=1 Tax=Marinobacter daqiaonensis TaxID=650891 RepID=A0A1I6IM18_9GAMM|nr:DUF6279 family lipoprotein [Marinobacter daqiaonensis]SFR67320.1 hypothetical protein SAMN05216203_2427 [Marinobacter daqiaonensis]